MIGMLSSSLMQSEIIICWSYQKLCEALTFLLDNFYIRLELYNGPIVGIPMGTNCAPCEADLFLFSYGRDYMMPVSDDNQSEVIKISVLLIGIWMIY